MRRIVVKYISRIRNYQPETIGMHPIIIFGTITIGGGLIVALIHVLIQAIVH
jgi:hypothetical protein